MRASEKALAFWYCPARWLMAAFAASASSVGRPQAAIAAAPLLSRQNRSRARSGAALIH